jgi:hypothetical protein
MGEEGKSEMEKTFNFGASLTIRLIWRGMLGLGGSTSKRLGLQRGRESLTLSSMKT